jgi:hypothetical protein
LGWSFVLEAGTGCTFWLVSIWNNVVSPITIYPRTNSVGLFLGFPHFYK